MHEPDVADPLAVVVPHTHWDREWYSPFETMRFALVQFLDELIEAMEKDPELPVFLLDGQAVILEDYTEIRRGHRNRLKALVEAGRLRPGPFYVQPDEFHVSGEALVRNLLIGCRVSREYGHVMREGYLPDTFGHVHQLPQILQGFGIDTFYAMRGFGDEVDATGTEFLWRAPDGSRVRAHWLAESYSNAAVLTGDPETLSLHHGVLVGYDRLAELLQRLQARSGTGVLLLLNGGDHLRVQEGVPAMVRSLDAAQKRDGGPRLRLGGLEEFHRLSAERPGPGSEISGELRHGRSHDVFDGIGSTRTPLKVLNENTEARLSGIAERLEACAALLDGRSQHDSLHYAWRELVKNYAHDSICGCSVDEVHQEMQVRFARIRQVADAVADDALARIAHTAASEPDTDPRRIPVVVVNPSAFPRGGTVTAEVLPDLGAPLGQRRFGWTQSEEGADWSGYALLGPDGRRIPFTVEPGTAVNVADTLDRRKEVYRDRIRFQAADVPALGSRVHHLVPAAQAPHQPTREASGTRRTARSLTNRWLSVEVAPDGTLAVTDLRTGRRSTGLCELLDDADAGDTYGHGPLPGDRPLSSRDANWSVEPGSEDDTLLARAVLALPAALTPERDARTGHTVDVPVTLLLRLPPAADRVEVDLTVDNRAEDHRLRLRIPTGVHTGESVAESAYGLVRRPAKAPACEGWRDQPTGAQALRRFVALEEAGAGLAVFTEGLHEYAHTDGHVLEVTLLRSVGWMARQDHPMRPHKVGPMLPTPDAQCPGQQHFRLALRPYAGTGHTVDLYRTAEEFALPLLTHAVQSSRPGPAPGAPPLGLAVAPASVVLSALKSAEDGDGVVVRVFNGSAEPVTASLVTAFPLASAVLCDLEEEPQHDTEPQAHRTLRFPLPAGRIQTVRLRPAPSGAAATESTVGR
ncbi:glycoside hydrolase family 38 C-terminal domain-containing protein [Streptomyces sp. DSM 42041]|uniref:Glycoside hydrolase family 38 C-terminal domain-containing protein n=1 Tax=Streptomyces hazeniae TaxID=3075538 RepID=A0ABU2NZV8_9ACTN|nr:glycosyl hydrolase-related protein [Streptomyces sp. DSM 42041]MDT0382513.1 glycoside hydrolase family 38 C-terminal domain-containing protein [Streptomyces sp. DSM 42041]